MASPPGKITFGEQLASLDVGGFIFTETLHRPGLVLGTHDHECANFNLMVAGGCRETMRGETESCGPAMLVVRPAGEPHSNHYGPHGARGLIVEVTPPLLAALGPHRRLFDIPRRVERGPLVVLAARMVRELRAREASYELMLEGLGLEFVGQLDRRHPEAGARTPPAWLRRARERLHAAPGAPLRLSALAADAGVDPTYFARAFRRWFGCSAGEYARRLRLERAADLLVHSWLPLAEVAQDAGFCDQSHFTNAFKRRYGMTPRQYRRTWSVGDSGPSRHSGRGGRCGHSA